MSHQKLELIFEPDFPNEVTTIRICEECFGSSFEAFETSHGYHMEKCQWCTNGIMSVQQHALWQRVKG